MGKAARSKRDRPAATRIVLTPREFADHQGVCAVAALKVQAIQQQAQAQITAALQERQKSFLRLVTKYRAQGMRPDADYVFDEADHALVATNREAPSGM